MIQRMQSLWLFVAALLNMGDFVFDDYDAHVVANGSDSMVHIRANNDFLAILLLLIICVLPLVDIFLFKTRKRQLSIITLSIVGIVAFLAYVVMQVTNLNNKVPAPTSGHYWIGAVLPVFSIVFLIMARNGIKKDDKLVKSADRLR